MKYWATFISVFFDTNNAYKILEYCNSNWGKDLSDFHLESFSNLHVTLFYIGWCDEKNIGKINNILMQTRALPALELNGKIRSFQVNDDCQYITLEVTQTPTIYTLYSDIRQKLVDENIVFKNQDFLPHVTIAKIPKCIEQKWHVAENPITISGHRIVLSHTKSSFYEL